jgi:polyhydroxyalkanoate synthase
MYPMSGIKWWFETMDDARRQRGAAMDKAGLGPKETPHRIVLERPGFRLRFYGGKSGRPVALIVPAPIKRHYIWDLSPRRSVVRHALDEDFRVFLVEWTEPIGEAAGYGLEEYAGCLLDACIEAIQDTAGTDRLILLGHSLGGVLATLYAARRPQHVASLVNVEAPLHFGKASGSFLPLVAFGPRAQKVAQLFDTIPGSLLSFASVSASPASFTVERYADLVRSMGSDDALRSHFLVQRWTLDESPMSRRLFEDVVEQLYRLDRFMRGTLVMEGKQFGPQDVQAPFLAVCDPRSLVVPPESIVDFLREAGSGIKRVMCYEGDTGVALAHVGALVGDNAHRRLWPHIFDWMRSPAAMRQ